MQINESSSGHQSDRRAYRQPQLTFYGRVRDLTRAAGGSPQAEQNCGSGGDNAINRNARGTRVCSDPNAKENIVRIGTHPAGMGLYLFNYKKNFRTEWGFGRQFGVMADEVECILPDAVAIRPEGYKMVDYSMLGISRGSQLN